MKRIVYTKRGGLEAIEIIEEDAPTPKADEVLIEVHRAGINFADLMMRQGLYGAAPDFPFTPGYEVSGVVLATGQDVKEHEVGDRVVALTGFGGYAEQVVVAQERAWTLPDNVSFDAAAAMPVTYLTSHHMLVHLGNFREGDSVLVHHAAGGVGTATAQIVKALNGGTIYGTASSEKGKFVEEMGMVHIPRGTDFVQRIKSDGDGVHHALVEEGVLGLWLVSDRPLIEAVAVFHIGIARIVLDFVAHVPLGRTREEQTRKQQQQASRHGVRSFVRMAGCNPSLTVM